MKISNSRLESIGKFLNIVLIVFSTLIDNSVTNKRFKESKQAWISAVKGQPIQGTFSTFISGTITI